MNIPIGSNSLHRVPAGNVLEAKLKKQSNTDQELMEVCKSFEAYMVEQVFKNMKKTVNTEEDNNQYTQFFGDMLYEEYAKSLTNNQSLGIAQMLYDSMKRNG